MKSKNSQENSVNSKAVIKAAKSELKQKALEEELKHKKMDKMKLLLAIIVVVASIWGFYALKLPKYVLVAMPFVGVAIALAIVFFWCDIGKRLISYIKDSFVELKKVVWPEKNDAIKTTIYVVLFVAALALFIWLADSLVSWLFFDVLLKRG